MKFYTQDFQQAYRLIENILRKIRKTGLKLDAGGKPSTWLPPGRLVEHTTEHGTIEYTNQLPHSPINQPMDQLPSHRLNELTPNKNKHTNKHANRQIDKQTNEQTNKVTNKQNETK